MVVTMSTDTAVTSPTAAATTEDMITSNSEVATTSPTTSNTPSNCSSPQLLQLYYNRLFPYDFLYRWMQEDFSKREFSFTIMAPDGGEIYLRYQSFRDQKELRDAIVKKRPDKIDIGAVFDAPPKDKHAKPNLAPTHRELVFDIDLTDYDEIRQCGCQGANICNICWQYMKMAVLTMDEGLRQDFGFQHICWIYSGRRGIHAWISDSNARELTDAGRAAVAKYFEVR